jgi:hypothetical protein
MIVFALFLPAIYSIVVRCDLECLDAYIVYQQPASAANTPAPPSSESQYDQSFAGYQWRLPAGLNGWKVIDYSEDDTNQQFDSSSATDYLQQQQQPLPWQTNVMQLPSFGDGISDDLNSVYYAGFAIRVA